MGNYLTSLTQMQIQAIGKIGIESHAAVYPGEILMFLLWGHLFLL